MAQSAQVLREDDGDDNDAPAGRSGGDAPVLRPVTTPPINRGMDTPDATQYEAIEVDDRDQPVGDVIQVGDDQEDNLSEGSDGNRAMIEDGEGSGDRHSRRRGPPYGERESRSQRRKREKMARETDRKEIDRLQRELDDVRRSQSEFQGKIEPRLTEFDASRVQNEISQVDREIAAQAAAIEAAQRAGAEAMRNNDADAFYASQTTRDEAFVAKVRLEGKKAQLVAAAGSRGTGGQRQTVDDGADGARDDRRRDPAPRVDPRVNSPAAMRYGNEFRQRYDWLDPKSTDKDVRRDSNRVLFLDAEVLADGYDPSTKEYWEELEDRMRDVMPDVVEDERPAPRQNGSARSNGNGSAQPRAAAQPANRRGPMTAGSSGAAPSGGKQQVRISPDRKNAMIESGALGADGRVINKAKFDRQVAAFAEFDRANSTGR